VRNPIAPDFAAISLPLNPRSRHHVFGFLSLSSIMQPLDQEKESGGLGVKI
jgi:hypothetical protein